MTKIHSRLAAFLFFATGLVGACSSDSASSNPATNPTGDSCASYCAKCGAGKSDCAKQCQAARSAQGGKCEKASDGLMTCVAQNACDTAAPACEALGNAYFQCLTSSGTGGSGGSGGAGGEAGLGGMGGAASCTPTEAQCVTCGDEPCGKGEACCGSSCVTGTCEDPLYAQCDGAEDCPDKKCCASMSVSAAGVSRSKTECAAACDTGNGSTGDSASVSGPVCRSSSDCASVTGDFGVPYSECCTGKDHSIGVCVSQTFASVIKKYGGTCGTIGSSSGGGEGVGGAGGGAGGLPAGCTTFTLDCNPLTNSPCTSKQQCGMTTKQSFKCWDSDGVELGGACDPVNGPFCAGTMECDGSPGKCRKFCCSSADCDTGTCWSYEGVGGTLGLCM